jgi:hypothetical protein
VQELRERKRRREGGREADLRRESERYGGVIDRTAEIRIGRG